MAVITLNVNYRPLRIGFCIRENNFDDIIKATGINTILWGGIYNPLISVGQNNEFASHLVKLFQIDLLYPVVQSKEIDTFIKQFPHLEWPDHYGNLLFDQNDKGLKPSVLDISHIVAHWWEKEFKLRKKSNCILPQWRKDDPFASVFSVEFGHFLLEPKLFYDYQRAYQQGLRAKIEKIDKNGMLKPEIAQKVDPIHITEDRLQLVGNTWGWGSHGIYIGDHTNAQDLINFWNLRAAAIDVRFTPITNIKRLKGVVTKHILEIHEKDATRKFPLGVGMWYSTKLNDAIVDKVVKNLFPKNISKARYQVDQHLWNGLNVNPPKPVFGSKTVLASLDWPYSTPAISIQLSDKPTEKENLYNDSQQLVFELSPLVEYEYKGYTLRLPFLPDLNEWYARRVVITRPWSLRVAKNRIGVIQKIHDETETIHPISNTELIKKIFDRAKITAKDSPPGIIAQRLIEKMGGLDECRFLKITGVRKLLNLSSNYAIEWEKAVKIIGKNKFNQFKRLYIAPRKEKELKPVDVWVFLLKLSIFIPKTKIFCKILSPKKPYKCNYCGLSSEVPIRAFEKPWICPYCDKEQHLPIQIGENFTKLERKAFSFKRSGIFAKDNKQEGAIPVILTLLQLLRRAGFGKFIYSTALKFESRSQSIDCEIDLAVLDTDYQGKVFLVIGECKTIDQITKRTIKKLLKVRGVLSKSGIDTYLLFSKTPSFSKKDIIKLKSLAKQNIPLILFTDVELEPYEPYDYYHKNNIELPEPYAHSFEGMARNSRAIYINKT